jgi:hypothetical protein
LWEKGVTFSLLYDQKNDFCSVSIQSKKRKGKRDGREREKVGVFSKRKM